MSVAVPSIIAGTMVLTGMINGAFNIQNNNIKHIISWILAVVGAICTCAIGGKLTNNLQNITSLSKKSNNFK